MSNLTPFDIAQLPMGTQVAMTGDDWRSDRDRKALARAEANRKKTALACVKKLEAAAEALYHFSWACNEVGDASAIRGADDSRTLLQASIREYANYLDSVYGGGR